jgi:hypothetical protein
VDDTIYIPQSGVETGAGRKIAKRPFHIGFLPWMPREGTNGKLTAP